MFSPQYKQNTSLPLIHLIFTALISFGIGYYLFPVLGKGREVKGTICLVIDDFGFAQNSDVEDFFYLNQNIQMD